MVTIYVITDKKNGYQYIGQTTQYQKRLKQHRIGNANTLIGRAIKKYGLGNFEMKPLLETDNNAADEAERKAIAYFNTLYPNGYNLDSGGIRNKIPHEVRIVRRVKPVTCVETGLTFESIKQASNVTGVCAPSIGYSCRFNCRAGGLHWEYAKAT